MTGFLIFASSSLSWPRAVKQTFSGAAIMKTMSPGTAPVRSLKTEKLGSEKNFFEGPSKPASVKRSHTRPFAPNAATCAVSVSMVLREKSPHPLPTIAATDAAPGTNGTL